VAHRQIMEAAIGPSEAMMKGKASRAALLESVRSLRAAISNIEEVLNAN